MAQGPIILFDFDGTLADTAPMIRSVYGDIAQRHKLRPLTDEDYTTLRRGTITDARKWTGIRWWQFPLMIRSIKRLMLLQAEKVKLFPGAVDLVRQLHEDNVQMYILSRNTPETIQRTLTRYKLARYVSVLPRRRRSLGGKVAAIKQLIRRERVDPATVWIVGDEVRDLQAAQRAGISSIAVTWGLQDESILQRYNPTYIVNTIDELQATLQQIRRA